MGARVVTGKSLCKGPKVGAALRGKEGQRLGRLGRRELGGWNLMAQVGRVGARPSPPGVRYPLGRGCQRAACHCHRLPPSALALPVPRPAPGPWGTSLMPWGWRCVL